ncbi:MAG: HD domain-containing protein [Halanaerobiales bacterium]
MDKRLKKQIEFLVEIDKIKEIFRHTKLFEGSRYENDAEHSWHLALMAIILSEYSNQEIDISKVLKMVLIHDIVEIDAGDYILYTDKIDEKAEKEEKAARRIFGILPKEQSEELLELWLEFERKETAEARFATSLDRLEPLMQNYYTEGYAWKKNNINSQKIFKANKHIADGSEKLWQHAKAMIEECIEKGLID